MTDYAFILGKFYPETSWVLNGEKYDDLVWMSETSKPSKEELDAKYTEYVNDLKYLDDRKNGYIRDGITLEVKIEALWNYIANQDSRNLDEIKLKIGAVDEKYPSPLKGENNG